MTFLSRLLSLAIFCTFISSHVLIPRNTIELEAWSKEGYTPKTSKTFHAELKLSEQGQEFVFASMYEWVKEAYENVQSQIDRVERACNFDYTVTLVVSLVSEDYKGEKLKHDSWFSSPPIGDRLQEMLYTTWPEKRLYNPNLDEWSRRASKPHEWTSLTAATFNVQQLDNQLYFNSELASIKYGCGPGDTEPYVQDRTEAEKDLEKAFKIKPVSAQMVEDDLQKQKDSRRKGTWYNWKKAPTWPKEGEPVPPGRSSTWS